MLTKRDVDRVAYDPTGPTTQITYDEGGVPGFGVRVHPTGRKSFVVWYRTGTGRARMFTLGLYGVLTLDQARKKARAELARVVEGADPVEERRADRNGTTVKDLAATYMERHGNGKKSWREDQRRLDQHVLPAFGSRHVADVRRADVAQLHNAIGREKPYEANRVLALISVLFSKAEEWGFLPEGSPNPARKVQRFTERSRDVFVTRAQMPALASAIDAEENPYVRAAFKMYLLTGFRRSELLGLRWKDVDLQAGRIRLGDTKAGRPHTLPLSTPAIAILQDLPRMLGTPYVFAGQRRGRPIGNIGSAWKRIRARFWLATHPDEEARLTAQAKADVRATKQAHKHASDRQEMVDSRLLALARERSKGPDAIRLHDLRRTVGSWLAMSGVSLRFIAGILNQTSLPTTQTYARLTDDAPRAALEELGAKLVAAGLKTE